MTAEQYFTTLRDYLMEQYYAGKLDSGTYIQILGSALNLLETKGLTQELPFYSLVLAMVRDRYPQEEQLPDWATNGSVVVPSKLIKLPDGSYVDFNGIRVDADTALYMIRDFLGTKDTLTAYEQAQLDMALQDLAWQKEQFGTLSAYQKEQLALARQQLGLEYNQYLAGLMASPADFIERWYAERLPQGTQLTKYPWGEPAVGTQGWAQQIGIGGGMPPTYGGGVATPQGEYATIPSETPWNPTGTRQTWVPQGENVPMGATYTPGITQGVLQNPWVSPGAIGAYTGFEGMPTAENLRMGGYQMPSYQDYMRQYPNSPITPEEYYSDAGAYELAAMYNPAYAFGAQQARKALQEGRITGTDYQQIKNANFVDAQGNPLVGVPYWSGQAAPGQAGNGSWAMQWTPQTGQPYISGINPSTGQPYQWYGGGWGGVSPSGYTGGTSTGGTATGGGGSPQPKSEAAMKKYNIPTVW